MKILYTRKAAAELSLVLDYIASHSLKGEKSVDARLRDMIERLKQYPHAGQLTSKEQLRRVTVTPYPYLTFYRVTGDTVVIHGVRHSAQKP